MGKKKSNRKRRDTVIVDNHQDGELPTQDAVDTNKSVKRSGTTAVTRGFAITEPNSIRKIFGEITHQLRQPTNHRDHQSNEELLLQTANVKERFHVGEAIFESTPLVYVLAQSERDFRCDRCLFKRQNLFPCEGCHYVSYCSTVCKEAAWNNLHKYECEKLKVTGTEFTDDCRYMGLLIMVLNQPESRFIADQVGRYRVSFDDLEDYNKGLPEHKHILHRSCIIYRIISRYLGDQMISFPEYSIFSRKATSATLPIMTGEIKLIGMGLYLGFSVFKRSCAPVACCTFAGPILRVTCLKEIPPCDAKRLTVNEILTSSRGYKRMFLDDHVQCTCARCSYKEFIYLTGEILNESKALLMVDHLGSFIEGFDPDYSETEEELNEFIILCEHYLTLIDGVLGRFNLIRAIILSRLTEALFDAGQFVRCRNYIFEWLEIAELYFNRLDPRLISIIYLLVQIEIFLGNRSEAKRFMVKALQLTRTCYGSDHPFYNHMISVYEHCEESNWNMGVLIKSYPRYLDDF